MKKLLAILLTLAMMLPLCGLAEENAPQATLTNHHLPRFQRAGAHGGNGGSGGNRVSGFAGCPARGGLSAGVHLV